MLFSVSYSVFPPKKPGLPHDFPPKKHHAVKCDISLCLHSWPADAHIKWNGPFRFGPTGIFDTSFEASLFWPVWSFWLVGPKCPFPFHLIHYSRYPPSLHVLNDWWEKSNVTWFLRGQTNDKNCQCKKSWSSLFMLSKHDDDLIV